MLSRLIQRTLPKPARTIAGARTSFRATTRPRLQTTRPQLSRQFLPKHFSSDPRIPQEVKYVRFGESGNSGGGGRWRPFTNGQLDTPSKILLGVVGTGGVYYVWHLERVEETGRWRFIDVSPEQERKIGKESDEEVLQEYRNKILPANHPITRRVSAIASRIITAANLGDVKGVTSTTQSRAPGGWGTLPDPHDGGFGQDSWQDQTKGQKSVVERLRQEWEVFVIKDDDNANAFVTGGGKIFVFTGILPIAQTDDGIATVIGHEIAHQVQRHSAEKMSGMKVFGALVLLLEILGLDIGISRVGLTLLMTLPNSRTMESEADNVGLRLMAQACYDPRESTHLWERMSEMEKQRGGGGWFNLGGDFLHTHPANAKRIRALTEWIPSAMSVRAGSNCALGGGRSVSDEFKEFRDTFGGNIWAQ